MATIHIFAERTVDASAETVYGYLADMRQHHPRFLPPAFSEFEVESGGMGHGTITRFKVTAGGRTREYRMMVAEPEPGRVLTESDMNSSLVTTFTVTPQDAASRVQISTTWESAGGIGGLPRLSSSDLHGAARQSASIGMARSRSPKGNVWPPV